jgi:glycine/D-amino acid oxidase-like deaminating enzyme
VGAVHALPGYYQAVAHSGVILAPLIGESLAEQIRGGCVHPLLARYAPDGALSNKA